MHLCHRPAVPADIPACLPYARGLRFYDPALRGEWAPFWGGLIATERALSVVVEDLDRPAGARLCAFCLSLFVADGFIADARTRLTPGVAGHVHSRFQRGASPILAAEDVGRANVRGGLNLLLAPYGFAPGLDHANMVSVIEVMFGTLFSYHVGYQIKEVLVERCGREWGLDNISVGLGLRTDHAAWFAAHPEQVPPPEERPTLLGLTRDEAFAAPGNRYFPLFVHRRPRLGLRPGEQRLLCHALEGVTNPGLARVLGVSPSAVKKRWEAIYARVAEAEPDLLPGPGASAGAGATRGAEKKDVLLVYLRRHPEELRPCG